LARSPGKSFSISGAASWKTRAAFGPDPSSGERGPPGVGRTGLVGRRWLIGQQVENADQFLPANGGGQSPPAD
jgi:hypothetical protein